MKTLITSILTASAVLSICSCTTVFESPVTEAPTTTTTTTQRTNATHPSLNTTETKTTRTY